MGQCATVHIFRGTGVHPEEAMQSKNISMLNGRNEEEEEEEEEEEDEEEEEEEEKKCTCCKYFFKCLLCLFVF